MLTEISCISPRCEDLNSKLSYPQLSKSTSHLVLWYLWLNICLAASLHLLWFLRFGMRIACPASIAGTGSGRSCCGVSAGFQRASVAPDSQATRTVSSLRRPDVFIPFLAVNCFSFTGWSNSNADFLSS